MKDHNGHLSPESYVADTLSLQLTKQEDICITLFGAKTPLSQRMEVALVNLKSKSERLVLLSVLIVPDIAVPLRNTLAIYMVLFSKFADIITKLIL